MKLFELLEKFKNGEKLRRTCWDENLWICFNKNSNLTRLFAKRVNGLELLSLDTRYSTEDVLADDWAIYEDKEQNLSGMKQEEIELFKEWFDHIAQIADDRKTGNGAVMKDSDALDEIKCVAKNASYYIENHLYEK